MIERGVEPEELLAHLRSMVSERAAVRLADALTFGHCPCGGGLGLRGSLFSIPVFECFGCRAVFLPLGGLVSVSRPLERADESALPAAAAAAQTPAPPPRKR